jgi:cytochrome c oxidase cbb3-type subunit 4
VSLSLFHAFWTIVLMIIFLGIVAWAWSRRRQKSFEKAARLPLEDDDSEPQSARSGDRSHG